MSCEVKKLVSCFKARGGRPLLGFDFDCTLTSAHFYKAFAWEYAQGQGNRYTPKMVEWCEARLAIPIDWQPPLRFHVLR